MSSKAAIGCLLPQLWWHHLVNAYEGKAGMVLFYSVYTIQPVVTTGLTTGCIV